MSCRIESCKCTNMSCPLRGKCCECVEKHIGKGQVPACFFSEEGEKTYDRSVANFYADYKKNN